MDMKRYIRDQYIENRSFPDIYIEESRESRSSITYPGSTLKVGSQGSNVRLMQQYLNVISNSYPSIPKIAADGIYGPATRNAVMAFQKQFGLSQDGIIGPVTWNKIVEVYNSVTGSTTYPGYPLSIGSRGNDVLIMQQNLNKISDRYPSIPELVEDGIFGSGTKNSVMAFQKQFGLTQDGIIGPVTWNKIIEVANGEMGTGSTPGTGSNPGTGTNPGTGNTNEQNTSGLTANELEVFNLINKQRTNNGLSALKIDSQLQRVARIKAQDMVDNNYFSHTSPTYGSPFDMLKSFGISYNTAGENIAANSSNSAAVSAWMNSAGHKANILNGKFNYTGIGVVNDPTYGKMYVQMFIGR